MIHGFLAFAHAFDVFKVLFLDKLELLHYGLVLQVNIGFFRHVDHFLARLVEVQIHHQLQVLLGQLHFSNFGLDRLCFLVLADLDQDDV